MLGSELGSDSTTEDDEYVIGVFLDDKGRLCKGRSSSASSSLPNSDSQYSVSLRFADISSNSAWFSGLLLKRKQKALIKYTIGTAVLYQLIRFVVTWQNYPPITFHS